MKYILYCRKSTESEDRQVLSLDSQEKELLDIAKSNNLNVVKILRESRSAKDFGRPVFNEVIDLIENNKADGILCWKLDRLARNMFDGGRIIDLLQRSKIKEIRTHSSIHFPNENALVLAMYFGMANQYVRDLSENVKRGNRAKLERGDWPNRAPIGYINNKADKTIEIDKPRKKHIEKIFSLYNSGAYSLKDVTNILYEDGFRSPAGNKVIKSQIHRILSNYLHCGLMEKDGKIYQGNHKPIISVSTFEKAQDILKGKVHSKKKKHFFSARGFLTCDKCSCMLTAVTKKGFIYYYCTNGKGVCDQHKKYIRKEKIDKLISKTLSSLKFDEEFIEIFSDAYKEKYESKINSLDKLLEPLLNESKTLLNQELRLTDTYTSGKVRDEVYDLKLQEIENRREQIKRKEKEIKQKRGRPLATFEQVKEVFLLSNKAKNLYLKSEKTKQRELLEKLLLNISIRNHKVVNFQFKMPYQVLASAPKINDFSLMRRE